MLEKEYHKVVDMVSPCAVITGNMIIDAVVYSRKMLAMEKNIVFDYNIKFPQDIAVNDSDMNRLLGNILDNAINAAEVVSGSTDECGNEAAFVKLKLSYDQGNLYMECVNSCNNSYAPVKYNDVIIPDHSQQGLGIPIIRDIVDMYNGTLKAYIANNKIFVLKLLLYDIESRA
jgi:sensor histidine kinase regulating citrate/malate metabolism